MSLQIRQDNFGRQQPGNPSVRRGFRSVGDLADARKHFVES
jgi:hypothetical protein